MASVGMGPSFVSDLTARVRQIATGGPIPGQPGVATGDPQALLKGLKTAFQGLVAHRRTGPLNVAPTAQPFSPSATRQIASINFQQPLTHLVGMQGNLGVIRKDLSALLAPTETKADNLIQQAGQLFLSNTAEDNLKAQQLMEEAARLKGGTARLPGDVTQNIRRLSDQLKAEGQKLLSSSSLADKVKGQELQSRAERLDAVLSKWGAVAASSGRIARFMRQAETAAIQHALGMFDTVGKLLESQTRMHVRANVMIR